MSWGSRLVGRRVPAYHADVSSLAEIERAARSLPKREMERLFLFLAGQLGHSLSPSELNPGPGRHGILDIPPAHLGQMLSPTDGDDLLGDMLEGRE